MKRTILLCLLCMAACSRAPRTANEVIAIPVRGLPVSPADPAWEDAPELAAAMIPQDLVEPRLLEPSTLSVRVRAASDGAAMALRLEWDDPNKDDVPGPSRMVDACAVQIPVKIEPDLPDPQMGREGKPVQVTYWRADWQATVDGRGDTLRDLYPNASIDHYPFEARPLEPGSEVQREMALRYAPAHRLGNLRSGPRDVPVEELVASGPGTLAPSPSPDARGKGVFGKSGWSVVISRKLPAGLEPDRRTYVAFAVWQGSRQEVGARKMRTGWIPLLRRAR